MFSGKAISNKCVFYFFTKVYIIVSEDFINMERWFHCLNDELLKTENNPTQHIFKNLTDTLAIRIIVVSVYCYDVYGVHNIDQYFVQDIMPHTSHIISIRLETGICKSL